MSGDLKGAGIDIDRACGLYILCLSVIGFAVLFYMLMFGDPKTIGHNDVLLVMVFGATPWIAFGSLGVFLLWTNKWTSVLCICGCSLPLVIVFASLVLSVVEFFGLLSGNPLGFIWN